MMQISRQFEDLPKQAISFFARRLASDISVSQGKRYTLATPLYLTLDDIE